MMSTKPVVAKQHLAMIPGAHTDPAIAARMVAAFRALRPHQWTKNALIFLPLILAHRLADMTATGHALLAFIAFSLAASGVYLVNDIMDVEQDRKHPVKRNRAIASGQLPVNAARLLSALCFVMAVLVTARLPSGFAMVLGAYLALNLAYTFYLKRKLLVDVLALAGAYTLRIMAGAVASGIEQSFWLLTFASFLFLSLALVKRYIELDTVGDEDSPDKKRVMGRGYRVADLEMLSQLGVASAFSAVLVLALYVDGQGRMGLYRTPEFIWLVCPVVLYVIGRIWVLARRRELPDDPVLFIIKDWRSHLMGAFVVAIMLAARHTG
jgi:4-hydroxybenzoate polyprenyltransferase